MIYGENPEFLSHLCLD